MSEEVLGTASSIMGTGRVSKRRNRKEDLKQRKPATYLGEDIMLFEQSGKYHKTKGVIGCKYERTDIPDSFRAAFLRIGKPFLHLEKGGKNSEYFSSPPQPNIIL